MSEPQQVVLITGCSSGIGLETAVDLAKRGYRVVSTMRTVAKGDRLLARARAAGVTVDVQPLDVTKPDSIAACAEYVSRTYGPLYALVNNAGFGLGGFFEDLTDAEVREQMETNFFGVLAVTRAFLPPMRQAGRGRIVNISSDSGRLALPGLGAYQASKFALEGWAEGLWHELQPFGVHVVLVEPGMVKTEIFTSNLRLCEHGQNPRSHYYARSQRMLDVTMKQFHAHAAPPEACNAVIAEALASRSPRLRYMVGTDAKLGVALKWTLPERAFLKLISKLY